MLLCVCRVIVCTQQELEVCHICSCPLQFSGLLSEKWWWHTVALLNAIFHFIFQHNQESGLVQHPLSSGKAWRHHFLFWQQTADYSELQSRGSQLVCVLNHFLLTISLWRCAITQGTSTMKRVNIKLIRGSSGTSWLKRPWAAQQRFCYSNPVC